MHDTDPWWDGLKGPAYGQLGDKMSFNPEMFLPKPFIANHLSVRFMDFEKHNIMEHMRVLYSKGLCWGLAALWGKEQLADLHISTTSKLESLLKDSLDCKKVIKYSPGFNDNLTSDYDYHYNDETLMFDDANYNLDYITNRTILNLMQQDRAKRFKTCSRQPIFL